MLCLSRRENETINLHTSDGLVEITVSKIRGNQARVNVKAPKSISIARSEVDNLLKRPLKISSF